MERETEAKALGGNRLGVGVGWFVGEGWGEVRKGARPWPSSATASGISSSRPWAASEGCFFFLTFYFILEYS